MKASVDELFELIQELTANEKRYFKKHAKQHAGKKDPQYLILFDNIAKMKYYDKTKLKEYLQNATKSDNLSEIKQYLTGLILKTLRNYHSRKNNFIKLQEYRTDIHLLIEKGLWKQARKLLRQAIQTAREANLGIYELEFTLLERRIIRQHVDKPQSLLNKNHQNSLIKIKQLEKELLMTTLYESVFLNVRDKNAIKTDKKNIPEAINEIIGDNHKTYLSRASFDAKTHYYSMCAMYQNDIKAFEPANKHLLDLLSVFEKNQDAFADVEYQERYLKALNNYATNCFYLGKLEQNIEDIMSKFDNVPETNLRIKAEKFQINAYFQILYYSKSGQYHKILDLAPHVEKGLKEYDGIILVNRKLMLRYNIAITCFRMHHYDRALGWVIPVINEQQKEASKKIQFLAELLRLILLFELGEHRTLKNLSYGFIERNKSQNAPAELSIATVLNQVATVLEKPFTSRQQKNNALKKIKVYFTTLHHELLNMETQEEFKIWLAEKIS